ncbi:hypothetical protein KIN34_14795 [Cellulomonas sp. DKR-3]|uniref:PKD domain-containing protein n=1 Tax=Cellulomonas fulva TaxID=2835530 RepID=A0ABS5U2B0_9CELL|nr:PKD domain-containing protein [Cellulomonas fulva]MBT0995549.1 hypothetical protein [Cellulomonas fulva]
MRRDKVQLSDTFKRHLAYRAHLAHPDPLVEYAYYTLCNVNSEHLEPGIDGCPPPNGTVSIPACGDDVAVEPLWRRTRPAVDQDWGPWEMQIGWVCPDELLPPFTQADFRQLTIEPPTAHRQPEGGDALVNRALIVYADEVERTFRTNLHGFEIDVIATPSEYAWDFGDGSTLTTTSPGAPYPSFELSHTYERVLTATVTLTTTWTGKYRVDEDPDGEWRDIEGTGETTTSLDPFDVVELRTRLTD